MSAVARRLFSFQNVGAKADLVSRIKDSRPLFCSPKVSKPEQRGFMAALLYKDFFIIATGQFDKQKELRIPIADISWHFRQWL